MTKKRVDTKAGIFRETSGAVKNLRRHYKHPAKEQDFRAINAELHGNDRSAVLLVSAFVESQLIVRINNNLRFVPDEVQIEKIYRFEGPLGTHSARCEIAWLLGVIDDRTYSQLDYLRELRNSFAHSSMPMAFTDLKVYNVAVKLFFPLGILDAPPFSSNNSKSFRNGITMELLNLANVLKLGSRKEAADFFLKCNPELSVDPARYAD